MTLSDHARKRMFERNISPTDIKAALRRGGKGRDRKGNVRRYHKNLVVVVARGGLVITAWRNEE